MNSHIVPNLQIDRSYYNTLDVESFALMLKSPSYCYKFYWLEALVGLISEGKTKATFDEIINEMICNAWYSVREFHIHLSGIQGDGVVRDGLERVIIRLTELSGLEANASKVEIRNEIARFDKELYQPKEQLTHMVPYRALAGFFANAGDRVDWESTRRLVAYVEAFSREKRSLPYIFGEGNRLNREVIFHPDWVRLIRDNTVSILGWIQYEKVRWLQNNNPEVPGLVYKLAPMDEKVRKLDKVKNLWKGVMELTEIRDIFRDEPVQLHSAEPGGLRCVSERTLCVA